MTLVVPGTIGSTTIVNVNIILLKIFGRAIVEPPTRMMSTGYGDGANGDCGRSRKTTSQFTTVSRRQVRFKLRSTASTGTAYSIEEVENRRMSDDLELKCLAILSSRGGRRTTVASHQITECVFVTRHFPSTIGPELVSLGRKHPIFLNLYFRVVKAEFWNSQRYACA